MGKEDEEQYPKRVDIDTAQRKWLVRVWSWAAVSLLGLKSPIIPDLIPRYTPSGRLQFVQSINPNFHHIIPVGESIRLYNNLNYNRPDNIIPIDASYHIGQGVHEGDDIEDEVIHPDQMQFLWEYGSWVQRGKGPPNPMDALQQRRRELTKCGRPYHNQIYDFHFADMARKVTDEYLSTHLDPWPLHKSKITK